MTILLAVDIADLQVRQFGAPHSGRIGGHQQHAVKLCVRRVDQPRDFFLAQDRGQVNHLFRIRSLGHAPGLAQRLAEEEPQGRQPLCHGVRGQLSPGEQLRLIFAHLLGTQLVGWTVEIARKSSTVRMQVRVVL